MSPLIAWFKFGVFTIFTFGVCPCGAATFEKTLTDVQENIQTEQWTVASGDVTPDCPVSWSVTKQTLHGGKQEGVEIVVIDNGKLKLTVVPTRGMGLLAARCGDLRLGWDSPLKEVVHPNFVNHESRGGLGWLEGFNEWMCRCGLEFAGHPGKDTFINNVGDEAAMDLTLHGKIANIPASDVKLVVQREAPFRISLHGTVYEKFFYGPKLAMATVISTVPGSAELRLVDTITNQGADEQEFEIIYHTNYGAPLLEAGAKFATPVRRIAPMNENAAKGIDNYATYQRPTRGFIEEVYLIEPWADEKGNTSVLLHNAAANRGSSIRFNTNQLPYLTVWKNTAAREDGYVTGLEPGTNFPFNRSVERKAGRLAKLKPGQSREFQVEFAAHLTKKEVDAELARIRQTAGGRAAEVEREP